MLKPVMMPLEVPSDKVLQPVLQSPPVTLLLRVAVAPTHSPVAPVMGPGAGLTERVVVVKQPVGSVYVMTAVPNDMPVTIPLVSPTVATPVLLLAQVPPPVFVRVVVVPAHKAVAPIMGLGNGFMVMVALPVIVAVQPVLAVVAVAV